MWSSNLFVRLRRNTPPPQKKSQGFLHSYHCTTLTPDDQPSNENSQGEPALIKRGRRGGVYSTWTASIHVC